MGADLFAALPLDVMEEIVGRLSHVELVMMCMASKELCAVATRSGRWEELSMQRWPLCCFEDPALPAEWGYKSLQQMYCARMSMDTFASTADMLHTVTRAARHRQATVADVHAARGMLPLPPAVAFRARQSVTELLACATAHASLLQLALVVRPQLRRSREHRVVMADVAWWLEEHATGILQYRAGLVDADCPRGLQQLQHMVTMCMHGTASVHQSVMMRLAKDVCGIQA